MSLSRTASHGNMGSLGSRKGSSVSLKELLTEGLLRRGSSRRETFTTVGSSRCRQRPLVPGGRGPEAALQQDGPAVRGGAQLPHPAQPAPRGGPRRRTMVLHKEPSLKICLALHLYPWGLGNAIRSKKNTLETIVLCFGVTLGPP